MLILTGLDKRNRLPNKRLTSPYMILEMRILTEVRVKLPSQRWWPPHTHQWTVNLYPFLNWMVGWLTSQALSQKRQIIEVTVWDSRAVNPHMQQMRITFPRRRLWMKKWKEFTNKKLPPTTIVHSKWWPKTSACKRKCSRKSKRGTN